MDSIPAKQLVHRAKRPGDWFGAEYNMNIYRGCTHGCIYCDSRSLCYQNPDFDTVKEKADALRIIRDDLRRKVKRGMVATGSMSDPYNPLEKTRLLTRHALELLYSYGFGAAAATKSPLIVRDRDILSDIAGQAPVVVKMTVTTIDDELCRAVEPGVAVSSLRLAAVKELSEAGIYCGILMMPVLPFLEDAPENVLGIVRAAGEAGARFVYPSFGMTLREGNREYYYKQLDIRFPGLRERYQKAYGERYICVSRRSKELWELFSGECRRLGLLYDMRDIIRDSRSGYESEQLKLF